VTIRILLADDHTLVREGLRMILEAHRDLDVVGESASGLETVELALDLVPDVVLMDIAMPDLDGIAATARLQQLVPAVKVVVLSMHASSEHVHRALRAGARGYVVKESVGAEVADAVRAVHAGRRYLSRRVAATAAGDHLRSGGAGGARSPLERLSPREREVLGLVAEGRSSAVIARMVNLSPKTVETYRSRLMKKLEVDDLASLIRFAVEHGLVRPS